MVVADVVERDVAGWGVDNDIAVLAKFTKKRRGVIGDSG
jgi:hypothetical protein